MLVICSLTVLSLNTKAVQIQPHNKDQSHSRLTITLKHLSNGYLKQTIYTCISVQSHLVAEQNLTYAQGDYSAEQL